jgi:hypothetical protein
MESDKPGILIRKYQMKSLIKNGKQEIYRGMPDQMG